MTVSKIWMIVSLLLAFILFLLIMRAVKRQSKDPEKVLRWRMLPMRFKLTLWLGITPSFILICILPFIIGFSVGKGMIYFVLWVFLIIASIFLEIACVNWYKKNGYL